ncbi:MAG: type II toxin-antitoxin system HicA family toxin [Kiritimatiellae bacterium]|jgi:predicted RNA binding protein YcfA (HicA-like mRNA interferase family)|nr:type II toxin-antitoxin system HicA family toxin [Kiritimatiellia bacterium]
MKPLTAKEVEQHLLAHGYEYDHTRGSHRIWINGLTGHSVPVPHHGNKPLKQGTLIAIFNACKMEKPKR